jgi:hypothetical protein
VAMELLESGQSARLVYNLPPGRRYCIATTVDSDGEVLVEMYHGLAAMREESAGEGGLPVAYSTGLSFTLITLDTMPAGYWFLRVRNVSNFPQVVTFDSYARPTDFVEMPVPVVSVKDTIVGWNGKPSAPAPAAKIKPAANQDDSFYKLMMQKRKANLV